MKILRLELRSTIEDMLPDDYTEEDVKATLEKLGNPAIVGQWISRSAYASNWPALFRCVCHVIKNDCTNCCGYCFDFYDCRVFYELPVEKEAVVNVVFTIMGEGIWRIIDVGLQVFFWLTLVFAIIERTDKGKDMQPVTINLKKWTPDDLKNISYIPKKKAITKVEVFGSLMWTAIWATLYFYANHLIGVYEGGRDTLQFITPALNQEVLLRYWPIVLVVIGLEIALALYKLITGQWTRKMAIFNTVVELIGTIVFIVIVNNSNVMHSEFIAYMTNLFTITAQAFKASAIGGIISIFVIFAVFNVFDGFRKAKME